MVCSVDSGLVWGKELDGAMCENHIMTFIEFQYGETAISRKEIRYILVLAIQPLHACDTQKFLDKICRKSVEQIQELSNIL